MSQIVESEDILGGKPRIEGTRVSAEQIYEMHVQKDLSPKQIAEMLPTVEVDGVEAAINYIEKRDDPSVDVTA